MPGRNAQVSRIYAILNLLEGNKVGLSAPEIQTKIEEIGFNASKRTVYRDLEALQQAGFPLAHTTNGSDTESNKWVLERNARINDYLVLSYKELAALYLARGALTPLHDSPVFLDIKSAFHKIESKLGPRAQAFLKEIAGEFHFEAGPKWGLGLDTDTLETVRAACAEKQVLLCVYKSVSGGSKKARTLGPHFMYYSKGSIYLVAEDLDSKSVKVFAVARMSDCEMTDTAYEGEASDPEKLFKSSFGIFTSGASPEHVVVEFSAKVASYVKERKWHDSQRVISKQDGKIECHFEVLISDELARFVLGFGAEAKVLRPEALSKQVISAAQEILSSYGKRAA